MLLPGGLGEAAIALGGDGGGGGPGGRPAARPRHAPWPPASPVAVPHRTATTWWPSALARTPAGSDRHPSRWFCPPGGISRCPFPLPSFPTGGGGWGAGLTRCLQPPEAPVAGGRPLPPPPTLPPAPMGRPHVPPSWTSPTAITAAGGGDADGWAPPPPRRARPASRVAAAPPTRTGRSSTPTGGSCSPGGGDGGGGDDGGGGGGSSRSRSGRGRGVSSPPPLPSAVGRRPSSGASPAAGVAVARAGRGLLALSLSHPTSPLGVVATSPSKLPSLRASARRLGRRLSRRLASATGVGSAGRFDARRGGGVGARRVWRGRRDSHPRAAVGWRGVVRP